MTLNCLVDLSHHNQANLKEAKTHGLLGVLHKATQGVSFVDPTYQNRRQQSLDLELYWGAYHFADGDDPEGQADFFLETVYDNTPEGVILCIDWEPDPTTGQTTMTLAGLKKLVQIVQEKTGIWPVIYGGDWMIKQLKGQCHPELSLCPLWQGHYQNEIEIPTPTWQDWIFWQYTDGHKGPLPHTFPGIGPVDRNRFNGDESALAHFWAKQSLGAL